MSQTMFFKSFCRRALRAQKVAFTIGDSRPKRHSRKRAVEALDGAGGGRAADVVAVESRATRVGAPRVSHPRDVVDEVGHDEGIGAYAHHHLIPPSLFLPLALPSDVAGAAVRPESVVVVGLALGFGGHRNP